MRTFWIGSKERKSVDGGQPSFDPTRIKTARGGPEGGLLLEARTAICEGGPPRTSDCVEQRGDPGILKIEEAEGPQVGQSAIHRNHAFRAGRKVDPRDAATTAGEFVRYP